MCHHILPKPTEDPLCYGTMSPRYTVLVASKPGNTTTSVYNSGLAIMLLLGKGCTPVTATRMIDAR